MIQTYFLGANSKDGFSSLYRHFPPEKDAFLHIIKSGPGTGKSGFMKRIGAAARERGLDVHNVLCSGDPDSLDGVYIPALGQAWVDGTAPHALEPRLFGVDSDYVNLGIFFSRPFQVEEKQQIRNLTGAYRSRYRDAYASLKVFSAEKRPAARGASKEWVKSLLAELPTSAVHEGAVTRRFLRAISCRGVLRLEGELEKLCSQVVPTDSEALTFACREILTRALPAILCPSPLEPEQPEALLLPELDLALTAFAPLPESGPAWEALEQALASLREAKVLHDQLEAVYLPHMDFDRLTSYTEAEIERLFSVL